MDNEIQNKKLIDKFIVNIIYLTEYSSYILAFNTQH